MTTEKRRELEALLMPYANIDPDEDRSFEGMLDSEVLAATRAALADGAGQDVLKAGSELCRDASRRHNGAWLRNGREFMAAAEAVDAAQLSPEAKATSDGVVGYVHPEPLIRGDKVEYQSKDWHGGMYWSTGVVVKADHIAGTCLIGRKASDREGSCVERFMCHVRRA